MNSEQDVPAGNKTDPQPAPGVGIPAGSNSPGSNPRELRRVVLSSFLGSTIEYYDFLLYSTAAGLVFSHVFFAGLPAWAAAMVSFGTLAVGYVARPLGGLLFGHFGDILGRKKMLLLSMWVMGVASVLIGLLPTTQQIGPMAGALLVTLRALQGIAVGGEWGGAVLMSAEHSGRKRRGFSASWTSSGAPAGTVLGILMFGLFSAMPEDSFYSYGWRIPFLFSAVLLVVGLVVRHSVSESPVFLKSLELQQANQRRKAPVLEIIKRPGTVIKIAVAFTASPAISLLIPTIALMYVMKAGADQSQVLFATALVLIAQIFTIPAFAALSDRVGRKPIMLAALIAAVFWILAFFPALATANLVWITVVYFCGLALIQAALLGPLPGFLSEQFRTEERYTGLSAGYQLSTLLGGFTPLIITALMGPTLNPVPAVIFLVCVYLTSAAALLTLRDRRSEELSEVS
ncbi:MFS transporter [Streptomyces sp. NPDC002896]|uniref:MFS transporter n=1 Tax=Streptomyces sp. NPDC002896 TaxID=3154438 RepID=UPI0033226955